MTRTVVEAELRAYKPDTTAPFVTIPSADIEQLEINQQIQEAIDRGSATIHDHAATYATGSDQITSGDRIEFYVQLAGENSLSRRWTGVAGVPETIMEGARIQRLQLGISDFVFKICSWRDTYQTFEGAPIAGVDGAILDTLLESEAPEVGRSQIAEVTRETDAFYNGRDLFSILREDLAPTADAVISQDGTDLVFQPLEELSIKHALSAGDFRGEISVSGSDDDLATLVRVDGGTDHDVDDEQPTQDSLERVTNTNRKQVQLETRKSEVDRVQLWTAVDATSNDDLVVRLQADRNGAPVDIDNRQSDIARRRLSPEFLSEGAFTEFLLPDHSLSPGDDPWLIIEATGADGHDIGVNANGVPTYRAEYPFPLLTRSADREAAAEYRRRDTRIKDESLDTFAAVRDVAQSRLRHSNRPSRTVSGTADSLRAHALSPGEAVDTTGNWPRAPVSGEYICTERQMTYAANNQLTTSLTLQEAASL